jgi:hypothetical protein
MMLAHFISETALLEAEFIGMVPSLVAAAVLCLALFVLRGAGTWDAKIANDTGYRIEDLKDLVQRLLQAVTASATGRFQAVKKKYGSEHTHKVSLRAWPSSIEFE